MEGRLVLWYSVQDPCSVGRVISNSKILKMAPFGVSEACRQISGPFRGLEMLWPHSPRSLPSSAFFQRHLCHSPGLPDCQSLSERRSRRSLLHLRPCPAQGICPFLAQRVQSFKYGVLGHKHIVAGLTYCSQNAGNVCGDPYSNLHHNIATSTMAIQGHVVSPNWYYSFPVPSNILEKTSLIAYPTPMVHGLGMT